MKTPMDKCFKVYCFLFVCALFLDEHHSGVLKVAILNMI